MPSDNIEVFNRAVRAVNEDDEHALQELITDDAEVFALRSVTEGSYIGMDGMRTFLADNRESFDFFRLSYDDVRDLGDGRVLAIGKVRIRGKGSGVETDVPSAQVITFREGRIAHLHDYRDADKALEAAGLA
jgi:ketosteroid isomerase-like protein